MRQSVRIIVAIVPQIAAVLATLLFVQPISAGAQEQPSTAQQRVVAEYRLNSPGLVAEPVFIERVVTFGERHFGNGDVTNGFYPDVWNMIPGSGFITGGPGYRHWYSKDRVFVNSSAALSWRGYKLAQARVELPRLARSRLALGTHLRWQDFTQVNFFGEGSATRVSSLSEYRLQSTNLVGYATFRPAEWIDIDANIGWLKPSILPRGGTFLRDRPDTRALFPRNIVFALSEQPTFVHSEAAVTVDTRDFPNHPLRGGLIRAAVGQYADRDSSLFTFRRYEAEAARFVPLAGSRVVIALHGWLVASDADPGHFVPFYLQPSLGGHNSLRGYADYRFHDRDLMLVNAEARVALMTHLDAAVFLDAGNVASRVGDLNFEKRSRGAGLRLHSRRHTYARLDVARGDEGWRFVFRLFDPLNLARISNRTAAVPFVP
jgi:hypothetical protein